MPTLNPWSRSSKLPQPDLTMFIKWNGVTVISDPTQWLPTPQHLKQNLSLSAFEWVHLPDCSLRWSAVKYWVLSYRAIIVMLHVWQWNWYELKSSGYIFKYFPLGLIAHKWKAESLCAFARCEYLSVCACGLLRYSHSQQWCSRNLLFIANPQTYSSITAYFSKLMWNLQQRNISWVEKRLSLLVNRAAHIQVPSVV